MSSRLFNELREKRGLAYEIGTQLRYFHDTGSLNVHAGIDNRKVIDALILILKEFSKMRVKLVETSEFRRAKEFYTGQLMLALEDTLDHMFWIGESTATLDKTYSLQDIIREINKITREDIRVAARQVFLKEKVNLALIGPLEDKQGEIRKHLGLA